MESKAVTNGILSFIIPGVGQYLNGDSKRAVMFLAAMVVLHFLIYFLMNNIIGSTISTLYHLYAGYDAFKMSG